MLLGIIFLNIKLNKPHFLRDEMIFMHCLLQIKQNILNRHFSCSGSYTICSKSIKKTRKVSFLKVNHKSTFSVCKGVSRASSDRIIYFDNKISTKSLICQTMVVNKVPNFPSFFYKYFA